MSDQNKAFALLVLGALLFAAALILTSMYEIAIPHALEVFTMLFGLPYVLREITRRTNWLLILYFLVLIPGIHWAATQAAVRVYGEMHESNSLLTAGLVGGLVGAGLAFLVLRLVRQLSAEGKTGRLMLIGLIGLVVLTLVGGFGLNLAADPSNSYRLVAWLYLPWQIVFAWFLSRLIRLSPPKGEPAA